MKWKLLGENRKVNFITEVLNNRGIDTEDIPKYLHTTDNDICSPNLLDNIEMAAHMLFEHMEVKNKILVIWDSDCDGMTSAAILLNFLYRLYPDVQIDDTGHRYKMHGLSSDLIIDPLKEKYDLVIIPDAGSNDEEQLRQLAKMGTDVIILDHHHADKFDIKEHIYIVNNQLSDKYPNKKLSGAGVVWQFIVYYNTMYGHKTVETDDFLDLVALGNTADVMSLLSIETKHLIFKGFSRIKNTLFSTLCQAQSYSMKGLVTPMSVGWYIAPIINGVIRSGTMEEKEMFFQAMLEKNAGKLVPSTKRGHKDGDMETMQQQAVRLAQNARSRQNKEVEKGMQYIEDNFGKSMASKKIFFVVLEEDICNPNLIGLIANKIASKYMIPTIIGIQYDGYVAGSGRNFSNSPVEDFRQELEISGLFNYAQGHASAFGFSIQDENVEKVDDYFQMLWEDLHFSPTYYCDFSFDFGMESDLLKQAIEDIHSLSEKGMWGTDMAEPVIHVKNIPVYTNIQLLSPDKKPTIKIMENGIGIMKFGASIEEYDKLCSFFGCVYIDIVCTVNMNTFAGRTTPQLFIIDYEKTDSQAYYF